MVAVRINCCFSTWKLPSKASGPLQGSKKTTTTPISNLPQIEKVRIKSYNPPMFGISSWPAETRNAHHLGWKPWNGPRCSRCTSYWHMVARHSVNSQHRSFAMAQSRLRVCSKNNSKQVITLPRLRFVFSPFPQVWKIQSRLTLKTVWSTQLANVW